jgi:hypothetical protein
LYVQLRQYLGDVFRRLAEQKESRIEDHQTPMPCALPMGKNAAAAISSGRAPLTPQNTIEVSQAGVA